MMIRHFRLSSENSGAIAKRLPHAKNQLSVSGSFSINSLQIYIYYTVEPPRSGFLRSGHLPRPGIFFHEI